MLLAAGCSPGLDEQVSLEAYEAVLPEMPLSSRARAGGDPLLDEDEDPAALLNPVPDTADHRARGAELMAVYCAPCHGPGGRGDGAVAKLLGVPVRDLTSDRVAALADGEIFTTIGEGSGSMLSLRGLVAPAERWLIVLAVRQLQAGAGPVPPAGDAE